jgi:hypothetical protein
MKCLFGVISTNKIVLVSVYRVHIVYIIPSDFSNTMVFCGEFLQNSLAEHGVWEVKRTRRVALKR